MQTGSGGFCVIIKKINKFTRLTLTPGINQFDKKAGRVGILIEFQNQRKYFLVLFYLTYSQQVFAKLLLRKDKTALFVLSEQVKRCKQNQQTENNNIGKNIFHGAKVIKKNGMFGCGIFDVLCLMYYVLFLISLRWRGVIE